LEGGGYSYERCYFRTRVFISIEQALHTRSEFKCELCASIDSLSVYEVLPDSDGSKPKSILIFETCREKIDNQGKVDANHWRCMNDSMWGQIPAVQVVAYAHAPECRRLTAGVTRHAIWVKILWPERFLSFTLSSTNSCLQINRYPVASSQCSNMG